MLGAGRPGPLQGQGVLVEPGAQLRELRPRGTRVLPFRAEEGGGVGLGDLHLLAGGRVPGPRGPPQCRPDRGTGWSTSTSGKWAWSSSRLQDLAPGPGANALEEDCHSARNAWEIPRVSVQFAVRDRARPLSVGRLYPPGRSGGPGLTGVILGFDPHRVAEVPSVQDAFDAYFVALSALDGTRPSPATVMRGRLFPSVALVRHLEAIVRALTDLAHRSRSV